MPMPAKKEPTARKVGVVGVLVREGRLLLIRRSQLVKAPGRYCFPGGGMEPGETEEQTLVREMQEELGVLVQPVRRLYRCVTPWRIDLRWWLADFDAAAQFEPHPAEVEAYDWYTPTEIDGLTPQLDSNSNFMAAWRRREFEIEGLSWE
jgi:8-oxo-dGTP pyrophosphatase MutT (NUDIX family)